jgi:hypothetical protein
VPTRYQKALSILRLKPFFLLPVFFGARTLCHTVSCAEQLKIGSSSPLFFSFLSPCMGAKLS